MTSFLIEVNDTQHKTARDDVCNRTSCRLTVSDLQPSTQYPFAIATRYRYGGHTFQSNRARAIISMGGAPNPPTGITAAVSENTAVITFYPSSSKYVSFYFVTLGNAGKGVQPGDCHLVCAASFSSLAPGSYTVQIVASNWAGDSVPATASIQIGPVPTQTCSDGVARPITQPCPPTVTSTIGSPPTPLTDPAGPYVNGTDANSLYLCDQRVGNSIVPLAFCGGLATDTAHKPAMTLGVDTSETYLYVYEVNNAQPGAMTSASHFRLIDANGHVLNASPGAPSGAPNAQPFAANSALPVHQRVAGWIGFGTTFALGPFRLQWSDSPSIPFQDVATVDVRVTR